MWVAARGLWRLDGDEAVRVALPDEVLFDVTAHRDLLAVVV